MVCYVLPTRTKLRFALITFFCCQSLFAIRPVFANETENVILMTMDGLRWQELFTGADKRLMNEEDGKVEKPKELVQQYFRVDPIERRQRLMPFFWTTLAKKGQVFGDPHHDSSVSVTNGRCFSYPGYNEILSGFGDPTINSNAKVNNKNQTVLEWFNKKPSFQGRVAAFASWDVFPFILNAERSGVYVNAGWQPLDVGKPELIETYNQIASNLPRYWQGVRYDAFTIRGAIEYLKEKKPRILYVSLGETDDWAHAGRYDLYLDAASKNDRFAQELWDAAQSIDQYKGKTSFVLTTDHGRGDGRESWKSHNQAIPGSERMWFAVMGPDTPPTGIQQGAKITQAQTAATVARLLGEDFQSADVRIAEPIAGVVAESP